MHREAAAFVPVPSHVHGAGSEYFRIWFVNLALTLMIFGTYPAAHRDLKAYPHGNARWGSLCTSFCEDEADLPAVVRLLGLERLDGQHRGCAADANQAEQDGLGDYFQSHPGARERAERIRSVATGAQPA